MAIVTIAEIQTALQVTLVGTELDMLTFIHPLVEGVFKSWLGTHTEYRQVTEILPIGRPRRIEPRLEDARREGNNVVRLQTNDTGLSTIQLRNIPVWESDIEVFEDLSAKAGSAPSAFPAASQLVYGRDTWLDINDDDNRLSHTGLLHRAGVWSQEPRTVKVTYFGGETAARLADSNEASFIKMGALTTHLVAYKAVSSLKGKDGKVGGLTAEDIGKYSYSSPEALQLATTITGLGVPLSAQEQAMRAKNMAVFG